MFIVELWWSITPMLEGTQGRERGVLFSGTNAATVYKTRAQVRRAIERSNQYWKRLGIAKQPGQYRTIRLAPPRA